MMATCARFAASATRLKSLRRASVEGALTSRGAGGIALKAFAWVWGQLLAGWACWWAGDDSGASIVVVVRYVRDCRE